MTPRYYDAAVHPEHEATVAYALDLRKQAIDAFWRATFSRARNVLETILHPGATGRKASELQTGNSRLSRGAHRAA